MPAGDRARRLWALVEIVGAIVLGILRGIARDGLLARGFSALDRYDFIEWLRDNGAPAEAVRSPVLIGGYDLAFAYRDGDPSQPALAAGQALRSTMRLFFTYKGAMFWKMEAGMGDVVFTPLYQVLKRRGVEFRFFHRVRNLRLSADRRAIGAVEMGRQVDLADGIREYDPLVDVAGLPCWPAEPRAEQIKNGAALRGHDLESLWDPWPDAGTVTLRAGADYDRLVFGISLGAVPYLCRELIEDSPRWRDMVAHVRTVATQAFQLWLGPDAAGLGWTMGQANLSGWVEPFDTYADMRQLVPREPWPAGLEPGSIAYFCNAMPTGPAGRAAPDPAFAAESAAAVKRGAIRFLRHQARHLWPRAIDPATGDFRWDLLVDDEGRTVVDRFDSQFWRANVDPSEHYVQSVPGSDPYRIKTDETGYDNLYVVGDWIDCGFNTGCVEAAVMSGLLASHAISGSPRREDIVGYGHP